MIFNIFEDDPSLLQEIQITSAKMRPYTKRVVAAQKAIIDLSSHNWADRLLSEPMMNKIRHKINSKQYIYNKEIGPPENPNIQPIPISQWVLQMNYARGGDIKQPVLYHFDSPDFVVVILLKDCDDPGGTLLARTSIGTEEEKVQLKKAGDTIILNGKNVEHCVTRLEKEDSERITLIMSLVDIENSPENVALDLIEDKINKHVIRDWLQWHLSFNTKSHDMLIGELLSKL